ncbi:hypothetical protein U1Q18_051108 [Sarracenia purpurea var. burkii]
MIFLRGDAPYYWKAIRRGRGGKPYAYVPILLSIALEAVGVTADSRSIRDSSAIDSGNSVRTLGVAISPTQSPTLCALVRYGSDQMVFKTSLHQQPRTTNYEAPKKIWSAAIPIDGFLRACS